MSVRYYSVTTGRCNLCLTILRATDVESLADVAKRHDQVSHPETPRIAPGLASFPPSPGS
jgi:hypothetical protein